MMFEHTPVLLNELIENLKVFPGGVYADGTVGGGGHAFEVAERLQGQGLLIGTDQDEDAVKAAGERLAIFGDLVRIFHNNYCELPVILASLSITQVNGIYLDLGVSSYQLDQAERGFTYREDAPLDMRMDRRNPKTAAAIVNTYSEDELARILYEYGEERCSRAIARNIVREREKKPITTTGQLVAIIRESIPKKIQAGGGHPAKRTFQALRIECNEELTVLDNSIDSMIDLLSPGGRLCIITFHSLEDRIVKTRFRTNENPCTCPPEFPVCVCGKRSKGTVVTKKPILPSEEEKAANPRSKSAKLRVFEKKA